MVNKTRQTENYFHQSQLFREITGENPVMLVDVGARGGIHNKWLPLRGAIKTIGFEPDADECARLNQTGDKSELYFPLALFNRKGKININLTRKLACSSILEPNYAFLDRFEASEDFKVTDSIEVPCNTLDELVKAGEIKDIDFIKIDTQGTELQILEGAENILSELCVFGIQTEMEFSPMYKDQPLFADVDSFLRQKGYSLFDIKIPLGRKIRKTAPIHSKDLKGQGLWTQALYLRDFISTDNSCLEKLSLEKAVKTIAIAELHGFSDFALELLDLYLAREIIDDTLYNDIKIMLLTAEKSSNPEIKLYRNIKRDTGEFLSQRFPFIYKLLVSIISRGRD